MMCGIFGIYDHPEASNMTYLGLYALQHRGQESCGIVSSDGKQLHDYRQMGLVSEVPSVTSDIQQPDQASSRMPNPLWSIMQREGWLLRTMAT
jgi:glutamine phosphoribosylpyrophosphate amidotransferase